MVDRGQSRDKNHRIDLRLYVAAEETFGADHEICHNAHIQLKFEISSGLSGVLKGQASSAILIPSTRTVCAMA